MKDRLVHCRRRSSGLSRDMAFKRRLAAKTTRGRRLAACGFRPHSWKQAGLTSDPATGRLQACPHGPNGGHPNRNPLAVSGFGSASQTSCHVLRPYDE
jgi:hypothetical protein